MSKFRAKVGSQTHDFWAANWSAARIIANAWVKKLKLSASDLELDEV